MNAPTETQRETWVSDQICDTNREQILAIARRIVRRANSMSTEALMKRDQAARQGAEEIVILAGMIERRMGGEHA